INQGRVEADRSSISPRRLSRILLSRLDHLTDTQRELVDKVAASCPEMSTLLEHVRTFAALLAPRDDNAQHLVDWLESSRVAGLPHLHSFTRGLQQDLDAVTAALTRPDHNGGAEGVNNKTKLIKRQMYGRAGFPLLRHRILLG
ncbi:transposase, partial [Streptomyces sp. NPDC087512]|uniref:transposase n=1 Tax=Streptomyces sp. NPDC087512 TaxID=3155059 RepID=UPI003412C97C